MGYMTTEQYTRHHNQDVLDAGKRMRDEKAAKEAAEAQRKAEETANFERRMDQIVGMADPFASQRGSYQQQLSDLINDPQGALANNPFFKASAEQGQEAAMRQLRRMGMGNSGNAALELQKSAQANLADQFFPMAQMLGQFSGAQFSPAAAAGSMSDMLRLRESQRQFDTTQTQKPAQYSWQQPATPSDRGFSSYWGGGSQSTNIADDIRRRLASGEMTPVSFSYT